MTAQHRRNVLALECIARLAQSGALPLFGRKTIDRHVPEHVVQSNGAGVGAHAHQHIEHLTQFVEVAAPGQSRQQRQRLAAERGDVPACGRRRFRDDTPD